MESLAFMLVLLIIGGVFVYGIYKFIYREFFYEKNDSYREVEGKSNKRAVSGLNFFQDLISVRRKNKGETLDYELDQFREAYFQKQHLMNRSEFAFFCLLQKKLPSNYTLFSKVRMEDFIGVDKRNFHYFHFRGYIKSRHVDFLICDKIQEMKPVLAIELDGKYHRTLRQQEVDNRKDKIYRAIGLKLERIRVGENFEEAIEERVLSCV